MLAPPHPTPSSFVPAPCTSPLFWLCSLQSIWLEAEVRFFLPVKGFVHI